MGHAEETTAWADGRCQHCGCASHTLYDGGEYCDGCARRVSRWDELALQGAYDG